MAPPTREITPEGVICHQLKPESSMTFVRETEHLCCDDFAKHTTTKPEQQAPLAAPHKTSRSTAGDTSLERPEGTAQTTPPQTTIPTGSYHSPLGVSRRPSHLRPP